MLLVSGGHCLLAVAKSVDEFLLLGESADNAPGEVLDKVQYHNFKKITLSRVKLFIRLLEG